MVIKVYYFFLNIFSIIWLILLYNRYLNIILFLIGINNMVIYKIYIKKVILKRKENFEIVYKRIIKVKWYNDNKMLLFFIISVVCVFK